jgi:hypothetical protein
VQGEDAQLERAQVDAVCASCDQTAAPLYPCAWCGARVCATCSALAETGGVWCRACIVQLADGRTKATTTYDDEVFDDEVAEDVAEARAVALGDLDDVE